MKTTLKTLSTLAVAALFAFGLTACNTVQGVGQDIAAGGKALSKVAKSDENSKTTKKKQN